METLIIQTDNEKLIALKDFLKEMNINFEVKKKKSLSKKREKPYNPEFVKKILSRMEDYKAGNFIELTEEYKKELFGK